jgi:hypothetical protein
VCPPPFICFTRRQPGWILCMHAWVTLPPLTWKRIQQCMQFIILHMHVNHRYTFSQKKCIHTPVVATVLCPWATVPWTVGRHLILFVWCHLFRPAYLHRSHSHSGTQHTRVVYSSYLSILIITWHYRLLLLLSFHECDT